MKKIPLVNEALELYATTPEGLDLWKTKNIELSYKNLLDNVFILSSDIAEFFDIRHNDLIDRNISKLQLEKYLTDHLRIFARMIETGKSAQRMQIVYALTRHEAERLIIDFTGTKARQKKYAILMRFQAMESDVLQGAFDQARQKAVTWDGVQLLTDLGFTPLHISFANLCHFLAILSLCG